MTVPSEKWQAVSIGLTESQRLWLKGVTAEQIEVRYSFDNKEYLAQKDKLDFAVNLHKPSPKYMPLSHVKALAKLWKVTPEYVMLDIVVSYCQYGRRYTCYRYRFSEHHEFDWLPKTGRLINTGLVWHAVLGKIVKWNQASGIPYSACIHREERGEPSADYMNRKLVLRDELIRPVRRQQSPLICESVDAARDRIKTISAKALAVVKSRDSLPIDND